MAVLMYESLIDFFDDYDMNEFGEISSPDWKYENENFMDYKFVIE